MFVVLLFQVHQVQRAPGETKDLKGLLARQGQKVIKETKGCQEWLDLRGREVLPDHQVWQGQRVHPDLEASLGLKDLEGLWADLETLEIRETLEFLALQVEMDYQGCQDRRVF